MTRYDAQKIKDQFNEQDIYEVGKVRYALAVTLFSGLAWGEGKLFGKESDSERAFNEVIRNCRNENYDLSQFVNELIAKLTRLETEATKRSNKRVKKGSNIWVSDGDGSGIHPAGMDYKGRAQIIAANKSKRIVPKR